MNLQTLFYIVGIVAMMSYTLLLIAMVILLFYIKKKLSDTYETLAGKIDTVKQIASHPQEVAASIGASVARSAMERIGKLGEPKKRKRSLG